jgi:hypothetical protein
MWTQTNYIFSYQYDDKYILLGKCCMKKHFKMDAVVKNAINHAEVRPERYCLVCEKHMREGIHKIGDMHYTCYIKTKLLPKIRASIITHNEQLIQCIESFKKNELTITINILRILENELMHKINNRKRLARWKYNDNVVLNDFGQKSTTKESQNVSNQDLSDIEKDIQLMNDGTSTLHSKYLKCLRTEVVNEKILENNKLETEAFEYTLNFGKYAGNTLNEMLKDNQKISYLLWLFKNTKSEYLKRNIKLVVLITKKKNVV